METNPFKIGKNAIDRLVCWFLAIFWYNTLCQQIYSKTARDVVISAVAVNLVLP